jgi:hypothetical protein
MRDLISLELLFLKQLSKRKAHLILKSRNSRTNYQLRRQKQTLFRRKQKKRRATNSDWKNNSKISTKTSKHCRCREMKRNILLIKCLMIKTFSLINSDYNFIRRIVKLKSYKSKNN